MEIGGAERGLLGLLSALDPTKVDIGFGFFSIILSIVNCQLSID